MKLTLLKRQRAQGFSLVEMLIASLIFVGVSAGVYSFLKTHQTKQLQAVAEQTQKRISNHALEQFKSDIALIDPNWIQAGLAVIYPHQGHGFESNYYLDPTLQSGTSSAPDGVTFLRRSTTLDRYYGYANADALCVSPPQEDDEGIYLYDEALQVEDAGGLNAGDWLMFFQDGQVALGVVESLQGTEISVRLPTAIEAQQIDSTSGLVQSAGVLPSTVDLSGVYNQLSQFCFHPQRVMIQKIASPVSYVIAHATNNRQSKKPDNVYLLRADGQKRNMLTRITYDQGVENREYLAEVDNLEITYDLFDSTLAGSIVRNAGRGQEPDRLLNVSNLGSQADPFFYATNIASVNMSLVTKNIDPHNKAQIRVQNQNIKASFDFVSGQSFVDQDISFTSYVTDMLNTGRGVSTDFNEQIGKPYYLMGLNGEAEMLVPTSRFITDRNNANQDRDFDDDGRVVIFDASGCPVNAGNACEVTNASAIVFQPRVVNEVRGVTEVVKFFPKSVNVYPTESHNIILVGGMSITETKTEGLSNDQSDLGGQLETGDPGKDDQEENALVRSAGIAVIAVPKDQSLESYLSQNLNPLVDASGDCNISGCSWINVNNTFEEQVQADLSGLVDTSNLSVTKQGHILVAPMTKPSPDSPVGIYKMNVGVSEINDQVSPVSTGHQDPGQAEQAEMGFEHLIDVEASGNRLVTAIGERTITIGQDEFLPTCTSKPMPLCASKECQDALGNPEDPENMGEIRLVHINSLERGEDYSFKVADHTYYCNALTVSPNNDLLIAGRLTVSEINYSEIKSLLYAEGTPPILYLDDIAAEDQHGPIYADGFMNDGETYADENVEDYKRLVGWRNGISSVSFEDGTFGLVSSQTLRVNDAGTIVEGFNVGVHSVSLPSSNDRIVASINTDALHLNKTQIFSAFVRGAIADGTTPKTYIPGNYVVSTMGEVRRSPTPMPAMGSAMSDEDWFVLFEEMQKPRGVEGLNSQMPVIDLNGNYEVVGCDASYIATCQ